MITENVSMIITRGGIDYAIEVEVDLEFNDGAEGSESNRAGMEIHDYRIVSTELSGLDTLNDEEYVQLEGEL